MVRQLLLSSILLTFISCKGQEDSVKPLPDPSGSGRIFVPDHIDSFYLENKGNEIESISSGSVSKGELINGKLIPFKGPNFCYFDTASYLGARAFLNDKVLNTVLEAYDSLSIRHPDRMFTIMECSNRHGGKIAPHRTHQNGLSIDFMMPLRRGDSASYELDKLGPNHYLLSFDDQGNYDEDPDLSIDFDLLGEHILLLEETAAKYGLEIDKVILKIELKDELYASKYGTEIQKRGIYITKNLSPLINSLHDDHYHIDFITK